MKQRLGLFIILIVMIGLFGSKRYAQGMASERKNVTTLQEQLKKLDDQIAQLDHQVAQKEKELETAGKFEEIAIVRQLQNLKKRRALFNFPSQQQKILLGESSIRESILETKCSSRLRPRFIRLIYEKSRDVFLQNAGDSIVWSPDGSKVVTERWGVFNVWDVATGARLDNLQNIAFYGWSPDSSKMITASNNAVDIRDAATGGILHTLAHPRVFRPIEWSPDGSKVAIGAQNTVDIWDIATAMRLYTLPYSWYRGFSAVKWSPDASKIMTLSEGPSVWYEAHNKVVDIWDAATGIRLHALRHQYAVLSVAWSPDGSKIVTNDGTPRIWDAVTGALLYMLRNAGSVAWSPSGDKIVTRLGVIYDAATGMRLRTLSPQGSSGVAWSLDGSKVATASGDGTVEIWDAVTGVRLHTLYTFERLQGQSYWYIIRSVAWSSDGSKIVIKYRDYTVEIWDAVTKMHIYPSQFSFYPVVLSPDGSRLATVSRDHNVALYNVDTLNKINRFIEAPNIDQCDLLQAFDNAIKDKGRIQATIEQWQTFTTFPKSVQEALRLYIKPPAGITLQEREAAFKQRQQVRAQKLTQPEQSDHNDDDNDDESYRGKQKK